MLTDEQQEIATELSRSATIRTDDSSVYATYSLDKGYKCIVEVTIDKDRAIYEYTVTDRELAIVDKSAGVFSSSVERETTDLILEILHLFLKIGTETEELSKE